MNQSYQVCSTCGLSVDMQSGTVTITHVPGCPNAPATDKSLQTAATAEQPAQPTGEEESPPTVEGLTAKVNYLLTRLSKANDILDELNACKKLRDDLEHPSLFLLDSGKLPAMKKMLPWKEHQAWEMSIAFRKEPGV